MLNIPLNDLAKILGVRYQGESNLIPLGVQIDSRKVKPGDLFFALPGENTDGHNFVDTALEKGAIGAVVSNLKAINKPENKNLVICRDPLALLQDLALLIRQNANIPVIAITGSTGKTTTKDLIFNVLEQKYKTIKTVGNYNNEIGLPLTICDLDKSHEAMVLEMGMRGLGQIDFLCQIAKPNYGVITNIGLTHAEILGSQYKIAQAKGEILRHLPPQGMAVLNLADKELLMPYLADCQAPITWFGLQPEADYWIKEVKEIGEKSSTYIVKTKEEEQLVTLNLPGEHNILNSLSAIALARALDMEWDLIKQGLEKVELTEMRLQIETTSLGVQVINDTYNANPASMEAALKVLAGIKGKRKIAILGDMYELGIYQDEAHKKVGEIAYRLKIDLLVAVGSLGKIIGQGALAAGMDENKVLIVQSNKEAQDLLHDIISSDDVILVKGSRGMKMEEIVQKLMG